ncbi:hypothetical protein [uncultured Bacteroides sp.]|uniref:hypothetical protein n=1 Tax=uncultured Bacteroides sp. TaxID=162156 RepID=UPI0025FC3720|nr:hypothetical protein [uncultured Bacteroides sp.]
MEYSSEYLKEILLDNDYPASNKKMLESVISQLQNLLPESKKAFAEWIETRRVPTYDIEGITPAYLRANHNATDISIILVYDGLLRNPKSAYLLKRPVILHPQR